MGNTKKGSGLIALLAIFFCCLFALPLVINLTSKEPERVGDVEIKNCAVEYEQGTSTSIHLKSGTIQLNVEVDNIFISVSGVGTENLTYQKSVVKTANSQYVTYTLDEVKSVCTTLFNEDKVVLATIYAEYDGRVYKIDEQSVSVISCWIGPY